MSEHQTGSKNGMWKGGRVVASNGYVLIRVGKDHHLADVRGYAYEHRIVAEGILGRRLLPGEQVHHRNEIKTDNRPENLEVCEGMADHKVHHRKSERGLRKPGEDNPQIECACGCGELLLKYDAARRPRKFVSGHNSGNALLSWVLHYLMHVPEPSHESFIAEMFDLPVWRISQSLARLAEKGQAYKDGTQWRARCG